MRAVPQFGARQGGLAYPDRPAAFGIALRDGLIAVVEVETPGQPTWRDLPGGGIDPGESPEEAVIREFGEETGLIVDAVDMIDRADQFFVDNKGQDFNVRGEFLRVSITGEAAALKIEDDHTLIWMTPLDAIAAMRREAHSWAIACWLRQGGG